MLISNETKLDYSDVLIVPLKNDMRSRKEVNLFSEYNFKYSSKKWKGTPIVAANMDGVGTFSMANSMSKMGMVTFITKFASISKWRKNFDSSYSQYYGVTSGVSKRELNNAINIFKEMSLSWFCIDIANGYSDLILDAIRYVRSELREDAIIVAGNVVTPDRTEELIKEGADIVKVGIGPGSVCTTRIKTGVGYPQLSAVYECSEAADAAGGMVMADGGCTCPGDIAKSFVAGADFSMIGGMLAGHSESEQDVVLRSFVTNEMDNGARIVENKLFLSFYGMSSKEAMENNCGGMAEYKSSEGRLVTVEYKGDVRDTLLDICGGLRSSCTYVGAKSISELSERGGFIRVNSQYNRWLVR